MTRRGWSDAYDLFSSEGTFFHMLFKSELVRAWEVTYLSPVLRRDVTSLEGISNYLDDFPNRSEMLSDLLATAANQEAAYSSSIRKLANDHVGNVDEVVLDATSLGLGDATRRAAQWITPEPGYYDVVLHGTADYFMVKTGDSWVRINHRTLANYMQSQGYSGGKVRLVSCSTGVYPDAIGQHSSNKLGVEVKAPKRAITVYEDGTYTIANDAGWRDFVPTTFD